MNDKTALILAAGKGTRMKSDNPKVLCEVLFKPMINWVIDACRDAGIESICAVTGYRGELVAAAVGERVETAVQPQQLGTGHAVRCAEAFLKQNIEGDVIVLNGDAPFIDPDTIQNSYNLHKRQGNAVTVITARLDDPSGYGRVVRSRQGIEKIVEQKDASTAELLINEVNSGAYWFNVRYLLDVLFNLGNDNNQGEYYLPDTIALSLQKGRKVNAYVSQNPDVILGANSRSQLLGLSQIANRRVIDSLMDSGVEFMSLDGILIAPDVKVGKGTIILPGSILRDGSVIGEDCTIGPNSLISASQLGNRTTFNSSQCYHAEVGSDVNIGPFCHLRPNTVIHDGVHIGDFVEVKNSVIGEETHISHLTYIGDSDVGKQVNFGCGVATANYDGVKKARCTVGDHAFIGCNTNLVAPVTVGENAYTAAGSTITDEVPDEAMGIARAHQVNKEGYNQKLRGGK